MNLQIVFSLTKMILNAVASATCKVQDAVNHFRQHQPRKPSQYVAYSLFILRVGAFAVTTNALSSGRRVGAIIPLFYQDVLYQPLFSFYHYFQ